MKNTNKPEAYSPQAAGASQSGGAPAIRRITSNELLAGQKELAIEHSGEEYRLRLTSKGKLILTK